MVIRADALSAKNRFAAAIASERYSAQGVVTLQAASLTFGCAQNDGWFANVTQRLQAGRVTPGWSRTMRIVSVAFGMCLLALPIQPAFGQPVTESTNPGKPKVYALVAAVGERFSFVHEVRHVDSHLEPYRRSYVDLSDNFLNRSVLRGLDEAIAKIDPDSKRIYLTLAAAQVENVVPSERESVALSKIVAELEKMPQRLEWDRIIVVTPAYKLLEINGMATKLQGFGVFTEPLTGNRIDLGQGKTDFAQQGREAVATPEGKAAKSKTY